MSAEPYELGLTRPARRAISEVLPEDVAAAAVEFITGPLLEAPYRVGKPFRDELAASTAHGSVPSGASCTGSTNQSE